MAWHLESLAAELRQVVDTLKTTPFTVEARKYQALWELIHTAQGIDAAAILLRLEDPK